MDDSYGETFLRTIKKQDRFMGPALDYLEILKSSCELNGLGNQSTRASPATQEFRNQAPEFRVEKVPSHAFWQGGFQLPDGSICVSTV